MTLLGLDDASTLVIAIGAIYALIGAALPVDLPAGRHVHYVLAHAVGATFLAVGPAAAWLLPVVALVAVPARAALGEGAVPSPSRRPRALLVSLLALLAGIACGHATLRGLAGAYPLPIDGGSELITLAIVAVAAWLGFVTTKEVADRALRRAVGPSPDGTTLERGLATYLLGAAAAAPTLLVVHVVYVRTGVWGWAVAMSWSLVFQAWVWLEGHHVRRERELVSELAARARLAAIGEVSARIAHQMRHQIGLIGISLHRIGARLDHMGEEAGVVRAELANLARTQDELRALLAPGAPEPAVSATWSALAAAQLDRLAPLAAERGVALRTSLDEQLDHRPQRAVELGQAWFNLVENAITAARTEVHARLVRERDVLVLSVEDDGDGMTDETLARATEPFYSTKPGGTGLGLAIARAAAEEAGGSLSIARRAGGGIRASLELPLAQGSVGERPRGT